MTDHSAVVALRQCAAIDKCGLLLCATPSDSAVFLPLRDAAVHFSSYDLLCRVELKYVFVNDTSAPAFVTFVGRYPDNFSLLNANVKVSAAPAFRSEDVKVESVVGAGDPISTQASIPKGFFAVPIPTRIESSDVIEVNVSLAVAADASVESVDLLSDGSLPPVPFAVAKVTLPLSSLIPPSLAAPEPSTRYGRSRHGARVPRRCALKVECRGSLGVPTVEVVGRNNDGTAVPFELADADADADAADEAVAAVRRRVTFVLDRSTSMSAVDAGTDDGAAGLTRWAAARGALAKGVAAAVGSRRVGDVGVCFFSDTAAPVVGVMDTQHAMQLFDQERVGGGTNLAAALDESFAVHCKAAAAAGGGGGGGVVLTGSAEGAAAAVAGGGAHCGTIVVVTDGAPDDVDAVVNSIERGVAAANGAVVVVVLQVGVDSAAEAFVSALSSRLSRRAAGCVRAFGAATIGGRGTAETVESLFVEEMGTCVRKRWRRVFAESENYGPPSDFVDIRVRSLALVSPARGVSVLPTVCWADADTNIAAGTLHLAVAAPGEHALEVEESAGGTDGFGFGERVRVVASRVHVVREIVGDRCVRGQPPALSETCVVVAKSREAVAVAVGVDIAKLQEMGAQKFAALANLCEGGAFDDTVGAKQLAAAVAAVPAAPIAEVEVGGGAGDAVAASSPKVQVMYLHGSRGSKSPSARSPGRGVAALQGGGDEQWDGEAAVEAFSPEKAVRKVAKARVFLVHPSLVRAAPLRSNAEVCVIVQALTVMKVAETETKELYIDRASTAPSPSSHHSPTSGRRARQAQALADSSRASPRKVKGGTAAATAAASAEELAQYRSACAAVIAAVRACHSDALVTVILPTSRALCVQTTPIAAATAFAEWASRHATPPTPMSSDDLLAVTHRVLQSPRARPHGYHSLIFMCATSGPSSSLAPRDVKLIGSLQSAALAPHSGAAVSAFGAGNSRKRGEGAGAVAAQSSIRSATSGAAPSGGGLSVEKVLQLASQVPFSVQWTTVDSMNAVLNILRLASCAALVDPVLHVTPIYSKAVGGQAAASAARNDQVAVYAAPLPRLLTLGCDIASRPFLVQSSARVRGYSVSLVGYVSPYGTPTRFEAGSVLPTTPVAVGGALCDKVVQADPSVVVAPCALLDVVRTGGGVPPYLALASKLIAASSRASTRVALPPSAAEAARISRAINVPTQFGSATVDGAALVMHVQHHEPPVPLTGARNGRAAVAGGVPLRPSVSPPPPVEEASSEAGDGAAEDAEPTATADAEGNQTVSLRFDGSAGVFNDEGAGTHSLMLSTDRTPATAGDVAFCKSIVDEMLEDVTAKGDAAVVRLMLSQSADGSWPSLTQVATLAGVDLDRMWAHAGRVRFSDAGVQGALLQDPAKIVAAHRAEKDAEATAAAAAAAAEAEQAEAEGRSVPPQPEPPAEVDAADAAVEAAQLVWSAVADEVEALLDALPCGVSNAVDCSVRAYAEDTRKRLVREAEAAVQKLTRVQNEAVEAAEQAAAAAAPPPQGSASAKSSQVPSGQPPPSTDLTAAAEEEVAAAAARVKDHDAALPWAEAEAARAEDASRDKKRARYIAMGALTLDERRRQDADVAAARAAAASRKAQHAARAAERARLDAIQLEKERKKRKDELRRRLRRLGAEQAAAVQAEFDAAEAAEDAAARAEEVMKEKAVHRVSVELRDKVRASAVAFVGVCWATALAVVSLIRQAEAFQEEGRPGLVRAANAAADKGLDFLELCGVKDATGLLKDAERAAGFA